MNTLTLTKSNLKTKALTAAIAVVAAVALPQIFHLIGMVSGLGSVLGETLLPMHLPVFFAALIGGPLVGLIVGAASPLLSFAIAGMPAAAMLPFMVLELAGYGLSLGLMSKTKMPVVAKLAVALVAGRAVKSAAILFAVFAVGNTAIGVPVIWNSILTGLPGIVLQLVLVPLAMFWYDNRAKSDDRA